MNARLAVALLTLLAVFTVGFTWLGLKMSRDDRQMLRLQATELGQSRLDLRAAVVQRTIATLAQQALASIPTTVAALDQTRSIAQNDGRIAYVFCLDKKWQFRTPNPRSPDLSDAEKAFLSRTQAIFDRGAGSATVAADGKREMPPPPLPQDSNEPMLITYRWSDGIVYLALRRQTDESWCGAELSTSRILADLLARLAGEPERTNKSEQTNFEQTILSDDMGAELFRWTGSQTFTPTDDSPSIPLRLAPPLQFLSLTTYMPPLSVTSRSVIFSTTSGVILLGVTVTLLAIFVLREFRRELREAEQRVSFVNKVSHELRTPLTNIRLYAELLEQEAEADEDDSRRRKAQTIASESERLSRLIGNILKFGEASRGQLNVRPTEASLAATLEELSETWRPAFLSRGMALEFELAESSLGACHFDRDACIQILTNLLSNCEKYARKGIVAVRATRNGDVATIDVFDQGPGITKHLRTRVFDPFFRISDSMSTGVSGTGIGLGVARDLARLHGGDLIIVDSSAGLHLQLTLRVAKPSEGTVV